MEGRSEHALNILDKLPDGYIIIYVDGEQVPAPLECLYTPYFENENEKKTPLDGLRGATHRAANEIISPEK
jgi:hypothetical protein